MRVKMLRTIERVEGDRSQRYQKDALWNVSDALAKEFMSASDPAAELAPDRVKGTVAGSATIHASTEDAVVVKVSATAIGHDPDDPPHVRLVSFAGTHVVQRPEHRKYSPAGATWTFAKPPAGASASAVFETQCTGFAPSNVTVTLPSKAAATQPSEPAQSKHAATEG